MMERCESFLSFIFFPFFLGWLVRLGRRGGAAARFIRTRLAAGEQRRPPFPSATASTPPAVGVLRRRTPAPHPDPTRHFTLVYFFCLFVCFVFSGSRFPL